MVISLEHVYHRSCDLDTALLIGRAKVNRVQQREFQTILLKLYRYYYFLEYVCLF